jgi:hypothetical protein
LILPDLAKGCKEKSLGIVDKGPGPESGSPTALLRYWFWKVWLAGDLALRHVALFLTAGIQQMNYVKKNLYF